MMKSRYATLIAVVAMVTLLFLQAYDVIKREYAEWAMISSVIFILLISPWRRRTRAPVRTLDPITLTGLSRSIELRDGVKRRLGQATDSEAGESNLDITLVDPGPRKIKTIKRLRQLYDIGLANAAAVVDAAPVVIRAGASRAEADYVADYLAQSGAKVEVTEAER